MELVSEAIAFAVKAHDGMRRKKSEAPYILHPMEAAKKLHRDAYHIMQVMNGIDPSHPNYRTEQNPENYVKTM